MIDLQMVPTNDMLAELDRRHEAVVVAMKVQDPDEKAEAIVFFSGCTMTLSALVMKLFFKVGAAGLQCDGEERGELETGGDDE